MRTVHFIWLTILLMAAGSIFAQPRKIDSLERELRLLEQKASDNNKVKLLNAIAWQRCNYSLGVDTALKYAQQALAFSDQLKWNKGKAEAWSCIARVYRINKGYERSVEAVTLTSLSPQSYLTRVTYEWGKTMVIVVYGPVQCQEGISWAPLG